MIVRQERVAIMLLCAVSASLIAASVILAGVDKSMLASEYSPFLADGTLVRLEGMVTDLQITRSGGHITTAVNDTPVFIPSDVAEMVALHEGDVVSLYGIVQTYQGKKEVVVNSAEDITLLT